MRYLPLTPDDRAAMLSAIGASSIDDLFVDVPEAARLDGATAGVINPAPGFFAKAFGAFAQPVMQAAGAIADAVFPVMGLLAQRVGHTAMPGTAVRTAMLGAACGAVPAARPGCRGR